MTMGDGPNEAVVIPPGGGEIVGDSPERRVEILSDDDSLHATWSRFAAGREGADLHVHRRHTDLFYVLEGELTLRLGIEDSAAVVPAGSLARVPPMVVHGFRNASDAEVKYLNLHAPGEGFADYLRTLRDGRDGAYDQHDPPEEGVRGPDAVAIGGEEIVVDAPGVQIALLCDVEELAIAESRVEAGAPGPPPHLHRHHLECFYVLEGELTGVLDDREARAPAGTFIRVPPGVVHTASFPGPAPTRVLSIHAPNSGFAPYLRALTSLDDVERATATAGFDQELAE